MPSDFLICCLNVVLDNLIRQNLHLVFVTEGVQTYLLYTHCNYYTASVNYFMTIKYMLIADPLNLVKN